jgi:predicted nucleic acid-binding protein
MSAADGPVFVDSNILVYAYDQTAGEKRTQARELLEGLWESGRGAISVQVLQEFYVTVTQKVRTPLKRETAAGVVRDLAHWNVHAPQAEDVLGAIDLQGRHALSFWDAMIIWSAGQLGCSTIWSEDLSPHENYDGVEVINPLEAGGDI